MKNVPLSGIIAGLDEAGRGSWAGPVVAGAVILPKGVRLGGLDDSKKLTEKERERLFKRIKETCIYGVGIASHEEVDAKGLLHATFLAFKRAIDALAQKPEHLYVDGKDPFPFDIPRTSVIKGDQIYRCIAAASIVAKVTRDHLMCELAKKYPHYGFELHKGYGTQAHQGALKEFGPCELHRKSYQPLKKLECTQESFL